MTEEEAELFMQRVAWRLAQCIMCANNPDDCNGEDDENGDCTKYKPRKDVS